MTYEAVCHFEGAANAAKDGVKVRYGELQTKPPQPNLSAKSPIASMRKVLVGGGSTPSLATVIQFVPVGMVLRNRQPKREEPDHARVADLHEPFVFRGIYERGRVAEIYETELSTRTYLPVEHGRYFPRIVILISRVL